jgi:4-amino-4-deoxy-L-arabinose transferase-like glycosyltransferase
MAESALLLGISLALWGFIHGARYPWLAGLGAALAFNAKQSAFALTPIGLLSVIWIVEGSDHLNKKRLVNILQYCGIYLVILILLNPFLWSHPVKAFQASWEKRQDLLNRQVKDHAWRN